MKNGFREGTYNQTIVHTSLELSTQLAKTGIREDRGSGFGPLGSHPSILHLAGIQLFADSRPMCPKLIELEAA